MYQSNANLYEKKGKKMRTINQINSKNTTAIKVIDNSSFIKIVTCIGIHMYTFYGEKKKNRHKADAIKGQTVQKIKIKIKIKTLT